MIPLEPAHHPIIQKWTSEKKVPLGGMGIPLVLFILSVYFWNSWPVYPFKLLTVFFHELSHGMAAVLTGGKILKIELSANEGGLCWTMGGTEWIILSAGYLGSLLWGCGILLIAAKTRFDRALVQVLGGMILLVTVIYVRTLAGFVFGLLFGGGMLVFANYFGEVPCDQLLRYIGLTSNFYVILDIKSDLIDRSVPISDAYRLAENWHLPDVVVGGAWFLIALFVTYRVLKASLDDEESAKGA